MRYRLPGLSFLWCVFLGASTAHSSGLSREDVQSVIDRIQAVYDPIVEKYEAQLLFDVYWDGNMGEQVNLGSSQLGNAWSIHLYKGYVDLPNINEDTLSLSLCHELGHHLGGYPFQLIWSSSEGQADYYANYVCTTLLWENEIEINETFSEKVDAYSKQRCDSIYDFDEQRFLCYRKSVAGLGLANIMAHYSKIDPVDPGQVDYIPVTKTIMNEHSDPQCRFETFVRGSLCSKKKLASKIPGKTSSAVVPVPREPAGSNKLWAAKESETYTCSLTDAESKFVLGARPSCWFKPYFLED